jgi:hypothetical protein
MSFETIATTSVVWLWEQYGKTLTDKALGQVHTKWAKFRWREAESKYRARLYRCPEKFFPQHKD